MELLRLRRCTTWPPMVVVRGTLLSLLGLLVLGSCVPVAEPAKVDDDPSLPAGYVTLERVPGFGYARITQSGLRLRAGEGYTFSMRLLGRVAFDTSDHIPNLESRVVVDGIVQEFGPTNVRSRYEDGWTFFEADVAVPFSGTFNLRMALWSRPSIVFTGVSLRDASGTELVRNGSFARGLAYWASDAFDRLSWSPTPVAASPTTLEAPIAATPRGQACLDLRTEPPLRNRANSVDGLLVVYTRFDGGREVLRAYEEARVTLLIPDDPPVEEGEVREIACRLDASWAFFEQVTATRPAVAGVALAVGERVVDYRRPTLAVVETTCGAGCGNLGMYGIEIGRYFWHETVANHRSGAETRALFEYEMGRNFWRFGNNLQSPVPSESGYHLATAFATVFGHLAGVAAGSATGPGHENYEWVQTHRRAFDAYRAYPDFATLLRGGIVNQKVQGGLWLHLGDTYGADFFPRFFRAVLVQPRARSLAGAVNNYVTAASIAAGADLVDWFVEELGFPASASLRQRVAGALRGAP